MIKKIGVYQDKKDQTIKCVYQINKKVIEMSMLYNREEKDVICVPTHYFCTLGCKMCHLTSIKTNQTMSKIKIEEWFDCFKNTIQQYKRNKKNLIISFMGVGEPLLNLELLEEVFQKEEKIKELGYENIGYAISTMMPNKNLLKLIEIVKEKKVALKVHFSLHNPIDKKRKELIPSTKVEVEDALNLLLLYEYFMKEEKIIVDKNKKVHKNDSFIEIHYTLIDKVNDGKLEQRRLLKLLKEYQIPIKFICFNPIGKLQRSKKEEEWKKSIEKENKNSKVKIYSPPGREIGSSCGDFTKHYYKEEETEEEQREFQIWHRKYQIEG